MDIHVQVKSIEECNKVLEYCVEMSDEIIDFYKICIKLSGSAYMYLQLSKIANKFIHCIIRCKKMTNKKSITFEEFMMLVEEKEEEY